MLTIAVSRRLLVQITAQNLIQSLKVCVKVSTKQTQKVRVCNETRFATKAYSQQNPFRDKSAHLSNCSLEM